jgi:hypothetical protein
MRAALEAGWMPHALAAFTGANTAGMRSPCAVLAARLSPAELPPPRGPRLARPPWCGQRDQVTRMLGFDGDQPRRARAASRPPHPPAPALPRRCPTPAPVHLRRPHRGHPL